MQHEFAAFQGARQGRFDRQPLAPMHIHVRREILETVLAGFLCAIHGYVAVSQQGLQIDAIVRAGTDADAGRDQEFLLVDDQRPRCGFEDFVRHSAHCIDAGGILHQDDEFVPAQPRQHIAVAQAGAQPGGDLLQQLVAGFVADNVVDVLEAVEVDQHQRGIHSLALAGRDRMLEGALEVRAIGNAGQLVVISQVLDVFLGTLAVGDVANDEAGAQLARSVAESG